jgi:hypothetical protein
LTLWDALEREALLRRNLPPELNMQDEFLRAILGATSQSLSDAELIERYISARVQQCVETATAFWHLDGNAVREYQGVFPVERDGLISYSAAPFADQNDRRRASLQRTLEGIGNKAGLAVSTGDVSPYRFVVSTREVGAPLFMLDARERGDLKDNEVRWARVNGHVYMDQRYDGVLPADFDLASTIVMARDHREARALVMAMHFGYMQYGKTKAGGPNRAVVQITRDRDQPRWSKYANGIAEALTALKEDSQRVDDLEEVLRDAWRGVSMKDHGGELGRVRDWVLDEIDAVASAVPNSRREALDVMLEAVDESIRNPAA